MRDINGAKAGGSQKKPYRAPVSATSTQTMRIKYGISEGTILGFGQNARYEDMLKRIYLDGTPIMAEDGTQLLDVTVEFRDGTQDQEPINGLPSVSIETQVGVEVKLGAPVSRSFDRSDTTSFDVRISVPTLYEGNDSGRSDFGVVEFKIDVSTDGGAFTEAGRFTIKEKILNGYTNTYNVPVTKGATHVVRVSRLNSEVVNDFSVNKLVLDAIVEITDVKLRYSNTAILYLEYDAEQFSNVPKLEMRVFGKNDILIPANYDPVSRTYATSGAGTTNGVWNGTWKRGYTDNPVWITLDLMLAKRYGLGDKIELSMINKWELYGVAQYCDELVPDGEGGTEPRFTCNNAYQQKAEDAYRVLKDLAASFRAKVVWDGEFITFSADVPRDPVFAFTNANTKDITYSSTQDAAQRNLINVQYYDKQNKFTSDVVMQRSTSNILSRGKVVDGNFTSLGCTSKGQAQRAASYVVNSELYETEIVTFTTGLEGGILRLNDVFHLADQSVAGRTLGGRVAAINGKVITLDREVPAEVNVGSDTQLILNQNDAQLAPNPVVSISADRLSVTLQNDPPASIQAGIVWALLTRDLVPQTFYVTDIEFDEAEMTFAVSGLQYNASKYAAIDGSARIVSPPISIIEHAMLTAPLIVVATYNTRIVQDISVCSIDVSWSQSANAVKYQLEMQKEGEPWRILGQFTSLSDTLDNMYIGTYTFRVCAYDSLGNASKYTYSAPLLVAGKVLPPPMLNSYGVKGILFGYQHDWSYPAHTEDSRAVRIRFTTIDPAVSLDALNYVDVAYPTSTFVEQDVSVGLKTWFSAAIVDKYGLVGTYTPWQFALPSVDPEQVLDLLSGQLTATQLDEDLRTDIATGVAAGAKADAADAAAQAAELAADAATQAADAATQAAGIAKTTADNAALQASTASTAASNAQTAAGNAQTAANTAKSTADQAKADVAALTTSTDATATDLRNRLTTAENGLTQEKLDRASGDTAVVGQLNTYKSANDAALAAVQQQADAATTSSSANAQSLTNLTSTVNTKNRTYRQTAAPTTNRVIGDLWINTTAGKNNEVRRWNGTAWDDLTDPRTAASATALSTLQTTVATIDGKTTANSNSITQLNADLSTLSNTVDTKSDASAVDSLTARVTTAEGSITSQGTRVTSLENSVNHATTGLASKASSSALTAVDNKVTTANGRIDTTNSNVTTLTGRVSTVEGAVATKADASALTALTTRVGNAEGVNTSQGTAITTLQNTVNHATTGLATKASSAALNSLDSKVTAIDGRVTSNSSSVTSLNNSLATTNTNVTAAQTAATNAMTAAGQKGKVIFGSTAPVAADRLSQNLWIDTTGSANTPKRWNGTAWVVVTDKVATDALAAANAASNLAATKADASALTALDSKVTTVDGKVTTNASNITTLQGKVTTVENGLATKADSSALNSYYTKTQTDAKATEIAAGEVAAYDASLVIGGTNLLRNAEFKGTGSFPTNWTKGINASLGSTATLIAENGTLAYEFVNAAAVGDISAKQTLSNDILTRDLTLTFSAQILSVTGGVGRFRMAAYVSYTDGTATTSRRAIDTASVVEGQVKGTLELPVIEGKPVNTIVVWFTVYPIAGATGKLVLEQPQVEYGNKATAWSPSPRDTQDALDANATAISNTTAEVGRVDGRVTTEANRITTLTGRVDTVEGAVTTKADATALTNLTTRVTNAENVNTSQGSAITTLNNTVNHATTGLATKASTSALNTLNSTVATINGKVTTNTSNITTLQGKMTTVENGLTTKANASALNDIYTKTQTDAKALEVASGQVSAFTATLNGKGTNLADYATSVGEVVELNKWARNSTEVTTEANSGYIPTEKAFKLKATGTTTSAYVMFPRISRIDPDNSAQYILSAYVKSPVARITRYRIAFFDIDPVTGYYQYTYSPFITVNLEADTWTRISAAATNTAGRSYMTLYMYTNHAGEAVADTNYFLVSRVMYERAYNLTNAPSEWTAGTIGVADKIDATAVATDSLTTRVTTAEGNITSQGTRVTNLENSVNNATTGLATKASASALTTLNNQVQHSTTGLSAVNTKVDNLKATIENTTNGLASKASSAALTTLSNKVNHSTTGLDAVASNVTSLQSEISYASAKKSYILATNRNGAATAGFLGRGVYDEKKQRLALLARGLNLIVWAADGSLVSSTQYDVYAGAAAATSLASAITALAANTYFSVIGVDNVGTLLKSHTALRAAIVDNGGSDAYYDQWAGIFMPLFTSKKGQATGTGIQHSFNSNITNDWIHYLLEFVAGIPVGLAGAAPVDTSNFASASAVESLTTRVSTAEGTISSEATKLGTLTTTVGNHTSSISTQQTTINGLSAKATLQVVAGNTVGGVALGNNAGVVDMIVRSNTFAIAPPTSAGAGNAGKYAFTYQSTSTTLPNGTVIPAGLYVDQAFIGQISASKINADSLSAISANLGTFTSTGADGGVTIISGSLIQAKYPNGQIAMRLGRW